MLSVLVGNIKGGCGKTTIATHLASSFAAMGLKTAIADCDRQRSSLNWLKRRAETAANISGLDWSKDLGEPPKGLDRLIIDAPAAMHHKDVEDLIAIADAVVVPVLPGAFDQDATAHFLKKLSGVKAVRKNKRTVAIIGNRLRLGAKATEQLDVFFSSLGFPVVARLRDSQIYPSVAALGSSVLEAKDRRARDYAAEWAPLLELLAKLD
ncbi:MAG: ParA family protein [Magnetospirillum sp.]